MGRLADEMESASEDLRFEEAAERRDQLMQLQKVQSVQGVEGVRGNLDILAAVVAGGAACVQVLFIREARILGSRTYYPPTRLDEDAAGVLEAFLPLFYLSGKQDIPHEIVVNLCRRAQSARRRLTFRAVGEWRCAPGSGMLDPAGWRWPSKPPRPIWLPT